ncbi:hypothetical protein [Sphingomonas dokdonensis]|uniref:Uncharacterized protein n=1 Tax=Sphingomonas dokdonensis TaxID=344880 RepID=A0A245ZCY6_9SPHN|nr:hypothetical protein [Sphingomonas dokdonensis]OWK27564.1 hypothetical protein SPDO_32470 [Sphingomonas dokdonensis]
MQLIQSILGADVAAAEDDEFTATARRLSLYRRKTIERLTLEQLPLRRAAYALRRRARGPSKLARRLRRRNELGRAGSF